MIPRRAVLVAAAGAPLYSAGPLKVFSAADASLIESICEQVIPADQDPGARQAGVLYYIDRQLSGALRRFTSVYRERLPSFRAVCRERMNGDFEHLSFDRQTEFLKSLETDGPDDLRIFFQLVIDHTMQGFYGSPKHGGNRDEVSWRMLKVEQFMGEDHSH